MKQESKKSVAKGIPEARGNIAQIVEDEHFDLENWPFYWLIRVHGRYQKTMEEGLASIELDVPSWRVLMLLEGDQARSVSYLADQAISKLSTMTRIVRRMQNDGLVETRSSPDDGRVTEVFLTGHGRRARVLAWKMAERIYARAFSDLDTKSVEHLVESLKKLCDNLDSSM